MSYIKITDTIVLLFSIYNKGEKESITNAEIRALIKDYL